MRLALLPLLGLLIGANVGGDLESIPHPLLEGLDEAVRVQLEEHRARVDLLLDQTDGSSDPRAREALATAFGDLGRVYFAYSLRAPAWAAFDNASRLAPGDFRWPYLAALNVDAGKPELAELYFRQALKLRPRGLAVHLRFAEHLLTAGRFEEAEIHFGIVFELAPESAAARFGLGRCAAAAGDPEKAVEWFLGTLERQPTADAVHYQLALVYRDQGKTDLARQELGKRGDTLPVFSDPVVEAARSLAIGPAADLLRAKRALRRGDLPGARELFERIVAEDPGNVVAHQGLAKLLKRMGELRGAADEYRKVVELGEESPSVLLNLGTLLASLDSSEQAIAAFRRAIEIAPDFRDGHFNLALELARQGDLESAERHLREVIELDPQDREARVELARIQAASGRVGEAIATLEALHGEGKGEPPICFLLGGLFGRQESYERAAEHFGHVTAMAGENGQAWMGRAMALLLSGGCEPTLPVLEEALKRAPSVAVHHLLARLLATCPAAEQRNGERALSLATAVLEREQSPSYLETLAMAYAELGEFAQAAHWQTKALEAARLQGRADGSMQERLDLYGRGEPCREPWRR